MYQRNRNPSFIRFKDQIIPYSHMACRFLYLLLIGDIFNILDKSLKKRVLDISFNNLEIHLKIHLYTINICYAPATIGRGHIVLPLSVRPSVRSSHLVCIVFPANSSYGF